MLNVFFKWLWSMCVCMLCIHVISLVTEIRKFSCTNRKNVTIYVFELEANAQAHTQIPEQLWRFLFYLCKEVLDCTDFGVNIYVHVSKLFLCLLQMSLLYYYVCINGSKNVKVLPVFVCVQLHDTFRQSFRSLSLFCDGL